MINIIFKPNKILKTLSFNNNGILTLGFIKPNNVIQYRTYIGIERDKAYRLIYHNTAAEALEIFSNEIKNKYPVTIKY